MPTGKLMVMMFPAEGLRVKLITRCCQYGLAAVAPLGTLLNPGGDKATDCAETWCATNKAQSDKM